jgi:hypothetical protein
MPNIAVGRPTFFPKLVLEFRPLLVSGLVRSAIANVLDSLFFGGSIAMAIH